MCAIFPISDTRWPWCVYIAATALIAAVTFGSLAEFPINQIAGDEQDTFQDIKKILQDPTYLFSADRKMYISPVLDILFSGIYFLWGDLPTAYHILLVLLHVLASLLLAYTFRVLGADLELSFLAALLFLMNVSHFRVLHWFLSIRYIIALILGLGSVIAYDRFLISKQNRCLILSAVLLAFAIPTHPAISATALFCLYWTRRQQAPLRLGYPLLLTTLIVGILAYLTSLDVGQVQGALASPDFIRMSTNPFWYLSRLITSAHWLPSAALGNEPQWWEVGLGLMAAIGIFTLYRCKAFPAAHWAIWSFLMVLPFINNPLNRLTVGPSRHLYFASAGACFVLAWGIYACIHKMEGWLNQTCRRALFAAVVLALMISSFRSLKAAEAVSLYVLGRSYVASGAFEKGLEQFKRAVEKEPYVVPADVYFRLATISLSQGTWHQETFENARKVHPDALELASLSGVAAFLSNDIEIQKRGETAIQSALEQALDKTQIRFTAAMAYQNLASYYHRTQNYEKAVMLYHKALALRPDYPALLFNLANALYRAGNIDDAVQTMKRASESESVRWRALRNLGLMHQDQKQYNQAVTVYLQMVQLRPKDAEVRRNLGIILEAQGNIEGAVEAYRDALALDPKDTETAVRLRKLLRLSNSR